MLEQHKDEVAKVLPEHVKVERVLRVARSAYLTNPYVQRCSPGSILLAVSKACELGLEPGGARNQAYLVPFKDECTLIVGYQGVLELARRSGEFRKIETRVVYANEEFRQAPHEEPPFQHYPLLADRGDPIAVYCYAVLKSGESSLEVMTKDEIESIRRRLPDRQKNSPAWKDFWGEMARKIVLKRHLKRMPQSVELAGAIEHSNRTEGFAEFGGGQLPGPSPTRPADTLAARLGVEPDPEPEPETEPFALDAPVQEQHPIPDDEDLMASEGGREG